VRGWILCPLFGLVLGFAISEAGFGEFARMHEAFTLDATNGAFPDLFLAFGGAVVLAGVGFRLFAKGDAVPERRIHAGTIPGALLFGAGWALSGGCPGIALVQLGHGRVAALAVMAAMFGGFYAGRFAKARLGIDAGSCGR
jgi:uncharacterized membrane protein YedE/YeeE